MSVKVWVTGENGFIGTHFIRKAQAQGITAIPSQVDILDFTAIKEGLVKHQPDVILHLAGISLPADCDRDPALAYRVNTFGTTLLAEALTETQVKARLLFSSTAQVYRPLEVDVQENYKISESHPVEPINLYARTKRMGELILEEFSRTKNLPVTVLRLFNHIHYTQNSATFLSSIYREIKSDKPVIPVGEMSLYRDMGAVQDLLRALFVLVNRKPTEPVFETFNICNGQPRELRKLAHLLRDRMGSKVEFKVDASRLRPHDPKRVLGSNEKLLEKTGWSPTVVSDEDLIAAFLEDL